MPENNNLKRYIDKEIIQKEAANDSASIKEKKSNKSKRVIVISIIIIIIIAIVVAFLLMTFKGTNTNNEIITPENTNGNSNINTDSNTNNVPIANITENDEIELAGRVFMKAYGTPSESYGLISTEGNEIGFGAYDSMREQFRPYLNENVNVIFSNVCKSTADNCCKSVFYYCGTVKEWSPIEEIK